MKLQTKLKALLLAGATTLIAGTAIAAPPTYNWTGFYVGANAGGGVITGYTTNEDYGSISTSDWGALVGATGGYNFMFGSFFVGPEVDIAWTSLRADSGATYGDGTYYRFKPKWDWFGTVRARAGVAIDHALIYATGGVAFVNSDHKYCYNADCAPDGLDGRHSGTDTGLALGVGTEVMVDQNISVKFDYLYVTVPTVTDHRENGYPINFDSYASTARIGVNWHLTP
jgi:outer membrane immunogenic protein